MVKPKILGTAYKKPKGYAGLAFASGRGAIYDIGNIAPTVVASEGGGNKVCVPVKAKKASCSCFHRTMTLSTSE